MQKNTLCSALSRKQTVDMVQLFYMDIIMHLIMVQILFFRLIQMVRHFPLNLNSFGIQREAWDMVIGMAKQPSGWRQSYLCYSYSTPCDRICFGVSVKDANTPFRLMKADTLRRYIDLIPNDFNLSNVVLSVIYAKKECRVKYLPITFRPRQGGINSINMKKIFKIGRQALKDFRQINRVLN